MASIKVAVTGGIGSGKSTVCKIIAEMGYQVFSCDEVYSRLLERREFCEKISEITEVPLICNGDKFCLDRHAVSEVVFFDPKVKADLEHFTHPAIMTEIVSEMEKIRGVSFAEVPLLFENEFQNMFDAVIVVLREMDERIASVIERSNLTEQEVVSRIKNQLDYENFDFSGHTLIYNESNLIDLKVKVRNAIDEIIRKKT